MSASDYDGPGGLIRITRDEALSEHVDDLLQRQQNMRGEGGLGRSRGRRWYYQNWLIFSLVATVAAIVAWALIEPFFDDLPYVQGTIQQVNPNDQPPQPALGDHVHGSITLKGQKIWLLREAKELHADGTKETLRPEALQPNQEVKVYAEVAQLDNGQDLAIAIFVETAPPPARDSSATLADVSRRSGAVAWLVFPLVGGLIGLAIGGVDGLVCRLPRRALLGGLVGLLVGFLGGFVSHVIANLVYQPLTMLAAQQGSEGPGHLSTMGFLLQMGGRGLAWALAGMTAGLGQGIALRSKRLFLYGFLGGVVGGLLGGLLFDPIDLVLLGPDKPSAHWARLIGFACIGLCVGALIGVVELLARDAWLRMTQGPLAGKEFLVFKDTMVLGSSPRSDVYLFNDPQVEAEHASLRAVGDDCEIENVSQESPTLVNGRPVQRSRLRHGDEITLGRTVFVFQKRQG